LSYDARDPSFANVPAAGHRVRNFAGSVGAYFAQAILWFIGLAAFVLPSPSATPPCGLSCAAPRPIS